MDTDTQSSLLRLFSVSIQEAPSITKQFMTLFSCSVLQVLAVLAQLACPSIPSADHIPLYGSEYPLSRCLSNNYY